MKNDHDKVIAKAADLLKKHTGQDSRCVLSQIDLDGYPTSSTISISNVEEIKTLFFCTGLSSNKVTRIRNDNRASVCINDRDYNISLIGELEVITDPFIKRVMWYDGLSANFQGFDDPNYCVLKFKTKGYSLLIDWEEVKGQISGD